MIDERTIARVLDNCATPLEAEKVAEFLGSEDGQTVLSGIIDRDLKDFENGCRPFAEDIPSDRIYAAVMRKIRNKKIRFVSYCSAAIVIPLCLIVGVLSYVNRMTDGTLFEKVQYVKTSVPNGDKMQIVLHDGTKVCLNSGSVITYPERFSLKNREVSLEGEGYFEVKSNPKRPFIISVPGGKVTVHGTSFDLCAYSQDQMLTLSLDEGQVSMDVAGETYRMLPGQVLYYNRSDKSVRVTTGGNSQKSKWMNGIVTFNSVPLDEIVKNLGRIFDVEFSVSSDVDTTILYTFTSSRADLSQLLEELTYIAPITISRKNGVIVIDPK